jgi:hypothetical protein
MPGYCKITVFITLLLILAIGAHPALSQSFDRLVKDTLDHAVRLYLTEAESEGILLYSKFKPSSRWSALTLDPSNACSGPTLEVWGDDPWGNDPQGSGNQAILFRASIYTCPDIAKAQALYEFWVSGHDSRGSIDFHGLTNRVIYHVEQIDSITWAELTGLLWIDGNLVFAAEPMTAFILEFDDIARSAGSTSLAEYIYLEAEKNNLTVAAENQQPPAIESPKQDQDQDGFLDGNDRCKAQAAPQSSDGCPPFEVQAQCGPAEPQAGDTVSCLAQAYGVPDGDSVDYQWDLNRVADCIDSACAWQAQPGTQQVSVTAVAKPSGKTASTSLNISVGAGTTQVQDDPLAGFTITYLGCSNEISSDEVMECAVGFQRQSKEIKHLVVVWRVDGSPAATETHTDDGSFYNLAQPAPGVHTIEVQVTDPKTGRSRVMSTSARIFPGQNASIPPGAGAVAGAGTATLIGTWLWSQWWLAKRTGKAASGSPISKQPSGPTRDEIYTGDEAREKLESLNIWGDLTRLNHQDMMDSRYRARRDELLDMRYDQRRVKSIAYKTKNVNGKEVIDVDTIVIILEEPEQAPPPAPAPPPEESAPPPQEPQVPEPARDKTPDKPPPQKTKPPIKQPVDPKEEKMRQEVKKWAEEAKKHNQEMDGLKKSHEIVAEKVRLLGAKFDIENKTQCTDGIIEAMDTILMLAKDAATLGQGDEIEEFIYKKFQQEVFEAYQKDFIKNLIKTTLAKSHAADQSLEPEEMVSLLKDPLGVKTVPGGAMKETIIQGIKRIPLVGKIIGKGYDYFEQTYSATREYRQHSENLSMLLKQKKGFFERQLALETSIHDHKVELDWAQKKRKEAQEALASYLKNRSQPPARLPR